MGFIDDVGHAFQTAGNAVSNTATSGGNAIAGTAQQAGNAISGTAKSGANTVATGFGDALAALDPERQKQHEHMMQAQAEWSRLDQEANVALQNAQAQAPAKIAAQLDPIKAQANDFQGRLSQYLVEIGNVHNDLQMNVEQEYNQVIFNLQDGLLGLTRLAMIFRGHSVEDMRQVKLAKGGNVDPSDFLVQVVNGSQSSFSEAEGAADSLSSLIQGATVQVRDLDQTEIPKLTADMTTFGKFNGKAIEGYKNSANTASTSIGTLQGDIVEQKQEVANHLHMSMTDDFAGIGKTILGVFGKSFPDDWDPFLRNHYQNIQNLNASIVQIQTDAVVANGIVEQATPIVDNVARLDDQTTALQAALEPLAPKVEDLKTNLNQLQIQVGEIAQVFGTLAESTHFDMTTAQYVRKLASIAASCARIDACCTFPAGLLVGQLMQVSIPKSATSFHRGDESGSQTGGQEDFFAEWREAISLPTQCSLLPIDRQQHEHFFPEAQDRGTALQKEIDLVIQNGLENYYTP